MAEKRMINKSISVSEQVNDLPTLFDKLLFTWMIPHTDDFGRMSGSPAKVKALVIPMLDASTEEVEQSLRNFHNANLIMWYEIDGQKYIQFPNFEKHQTGLHKRTKSKFPDPPDDSEKFPEIPPQEKGREQNLTEGNGTEQKGTEGSGNLPLDDLPRPLNPHKDHILNLINECKLTDITIYGLEQIYAYVGVVDLEVIETAIKKASGKHMNYAVKTLGGMKKDGITKKEQVAPKIPETGVPQHRTARKGAQPERPKLVVHKAEKPEATPEDLDRIRALMDRMNKAL